jgi:sulfide dehydrogenase cytochrome subunit
MTTRAITAAFLATLLVGTAAAQPSGRMLGDTCAGCHGTRGASAGLAMPTLAGAPEGFIRLAMLEFRDGRRYSTIMGRIAKGYSDGDIDAMAAYFSGQPWQKVRQEADERLAAAGKRIHHKKCEACHRDNGASTDLDMPRLAGQWRGYLDLMMTQARNPKRGFHQSPDMKTVMDRLTEQDISALANFYISQQ